jgi:hypothetical protein
VNYLTVYRQQLVTKIKLHNQRNTRDSIKKLEKIVYFIVIKWKIGLFLIIKKWQKNNFPLFKIKVRIKCQWNNKHIQSHFWLLMIDRKLMEMEEEMWFCMSNFDAKVIIFRINQNNIKFSFVNKNNKIISNA